VQKEDVKERNKTSGRQDALVKRLERKQGNEETENREARLLYSKVDGKSETGHHCRHIMVATGDLISGRGQSMGGRYSVDTPKRVLESPQVASIMEPARVLA